MSTRSLPNPGDKRNEERIPFYRNVKTLALLAQFIFLAGVLVATYILYRNVATALATSNLTFTFNFLDDRAGFDLGESAIPYSGSDPYIRAIFAGLLNTLKVGLAGVVLCSLLGVAVGVMRLSANWLLRTVSTGYVELLRNIPLAVQLVFWYYAVILSIPPRSDNATRLPGDIYLSQIGMAFPAFYPSYNFDRWLPWLLGAAAVAIGLYIWRRRQLRLADRPGNTWALPLAGLLVVAGGGYFIASSGATAPAGLAVDLSPSRGIGQVFRDENGNGSFDRGEARVPFSPVVVTIPEGRMTTISQNLIESSDVVYGTFRFPLLDESEFESVTVEFSEPSDAEVLSIAFDRYPSIGTVYRDLNGNGEFDAGEETYVEDNVRRGYNGVRLTMALEGFERRLVSDRDGTVRMPIFEAPPAEEAAAGGTAAPAGGGGGLGALFAAPTSAAGTLEFETSLPPAGPLVYSEPTVPRSSYFGGARLTTPFLALLLGLAIYTSAFVAEIVRGGLQAVAKGQTEAAKALGLSGGQTFSLIVFPQALRIIIPPMISQYLNLMKNSSLAILVTFSDFFQVSNTVGNQTGQFIAVYVIILVGYLAISLVFSLVLNIVNSRMALAGNR